MRLKILWVNKQLQVAFFDAQKNLEKNINQTISDNKNIQYHSHILVRKVVR